MFPMANLAGGTPTSGHRGQMIASYLSFEPYVAHPTVNRLRELCTCHLTHVVLVSTANRTRWI